MNLKVSVFEYLNEKIMYIQDVNYYFGIKNSFDVKLGNYELSSKTVLDIMKENDPEEYAIFLMTSIEERLNKINYYDIEEIEEQSSYGQYTLCLHPSRKCNLKCKYCFGDSDYLGNEQLTFEVAKDAIDFLVNSYAPHASKYVVDLSGSGEPLLQIDLIKQIVDYCKRKRNEACKNIEVMFCTNLTLLTPEIVEYLDNEPSIILGTSIDGDQITNDINRVYANEKGTYDDIVKGLNMFKNKKLGLAVTVTPLNQNVDLIYDHLYNLPNVDCVSMKYIRNYDGLEYDFDYFDIPYLISRYERLCDNIFIELKRGNFDYLKKLLKGADYFGGLIYANVFRGTFKVYRCDAGKSRITVDSKGDIYACSVMYGNEYFRVGSIYSGVNRKKQAKFECVSINSVSKCKRCEIKSICGGECYVNAYMKNDNIFSPVTNMCEIKKQLNYLSMSLISKIKEQDIVLYNSLLDLVCEIRKYELTSLKVWCVMYYLKLHGINVDYFDILDNLNEYQNSIEGIISCLGEFISDVSLYKVTSIKEIVYPSIVVVNKNNVEDFFILVDKNSENAVIKEYSSDMFEFFELSLDTIINDISNIMIF